MKTIISTQPDISLYGIRIQEPVTMLTDLLISVICFYAFFQLSSKTRPGKLNTYIKYHFLLMAIATFWGAVFGHGFQYIVGFAWRFPGWYLSMLSIMFIERASIEHSRSVIKAGLLRTLLIVNIAELLIMFGLTAFTQKFIFVQFHSVYGVLGVVFSFHLYVYLKTKDIGSKYMLIGVAVAAIAAFVYNYPVILNPWFNNLDLAHVLMATTSFIFYKATLKLSENSI